METQVKIRTTHGRYLVTDEINGAINEGPEMEDGTLFTKVSLDESGEQFWFRSEHDTYVGFDTDNNLMNSKDFNQVTMFSCVKQEGGRVAYVVDDAFGHGFMSFRSGHGCRSDQLTDSETFEEIIVEKAKNDQLGQLPFVPLIPSVSASTELGSSKVESRRFCSVGHLFASAFCCGAIIEVSDEQNEWHSATIVRGFEDGSAMVAFEGDPSRLEVAVDMMCCTAFEGMICEMDIGGCGDWRSAEILRLYSNGLLELRDQYGYYNDVSISQIRLVDQSDEVSEPAVAKGTEQVTQSEGVEVNSLRAAEKEIMSRRVLASWEISTSPSRLGFVSWFDSKSCYLLHLVAKPSEGKIEVSSNVHDGKDTETFSMPEGSGSLEMVVEVTDEGFLIYVDGALQLTFAHRAPWSTFQRVHLRDDIGWRVNRMLTTTSNSPRTRADGPKPADPLSIADGKASKSQFPPGELPDIGTSAGSAMLQQSIVQSAMSVYQAQMKSRGFSAEQLFGFFSRLSTDVLLNCIDPVDFESLHAALTSCYQEPSCSPVVEDISLTCNDIPSVGLPLKQGPFSPPKEDTKELNQRSTSSESRSTSTQEHHFDHCNSERLDQEKIRKDAALQSQIEELRREKELQKAEIERYRKEAEKQKIENERLRRDADSKASEVAELERLRREAEDQRAHEEHLRRKAEQKAAEERQRAEEEERLRQEDEQMRGKAVVAKLMDEQREREEQRKAKEEAEIVAAQEQLRPEAEKLSEEERLQRVAEEHRRSQEETKTDEEKQDQRNEGAHDKWDLTTSASRNGYANWLDVSGNVLFHFNPRPTSAESDPGGGILVMNSRIGSSWGRKEQIAMPPGRGPFKATVEVSEEGFAVLVDGGVKHTFIHRRPWSEFADLKLQPGWTANRTKNSADQSLKSDAIAQTDQRASDEIQNPRLLSGNDRLRGHSDHQRTESVESLTAVEDLRAYCIRAYAATMVERGFCSQEQIIRCFDRLGHEELTNLKSNVDYAYLKVLLDSSLQAEDAKQTNAAGSNTSNVLAAWEITSGVSKRGYVLWEDTQGRSLMRLTLNPTLKCIVLASNIGSRAAQESFPFPADLTTLPIAVDVTAEGFVVSCNDLRLTCFAHCAPWSSFCRLAENHDGWVCVQRNIAAALAPTTAPVADSASASDAKAALMSSDQKFGSIGYKDYFEILQSVNFSREEVMECWRELSDEELKFATNTFRPKFLMRILDQRRKQRQPLAGQHPIEAKQPVGIEEAQWDKPSAVQTLQPPVAHLQQPDESSAGRQPSAFGAASPNMPSSAPTPGAAYGFGGSTSNLTMGWKHAYIQHFSVHGYKGAELSACLDNLTEVDVAALSSQTDFDYFRILLESRRQEQIEEQAREQQRREAISMLRHPQIVQDIRVKTFCPEASAGEKAAIFKTGTGYPEIVALICTKNSFPIASDEAVLARVDENGWSVKLSNSDKESSDCAVSVCDLQEKDRIEVRRLTSCVRGKFRLRVIAATDRFNAALQDKIASLSETYAGYQEIRGDGNCYYRAIIFGLIEQIISSPDKRKSLRRIRDRFESLLFRAGPDLVQHQALLEKLKQAEDNAVWKSVAEFQNELLSEDTKLDESLVRACKKIVAEMLVKRQHDLYNGLALRDAILFVHDDVGDVNAFCREYVMKMGVCAEGAHIDIGLLPQELGCTSHIVILSREQGAEVRTLDTDLPVGVEAIGDVHLLFRPGHYDLLYLATAADRQYLEERKRLPPPKPAAEIAKPGTDREAVQAMQQSNWRDAPGEIDGNPLPLAPPAPLPPAVVTMEEQLCEMLSISPEIAAELSKRCSSVGAAVDYFYANQNKLRDEVAKKQEEAKKRESASKAAQSGDPVHRFPNFVDTLTQTGFPVDDIKTAIRELNRDRMDISLETILQKCKAMAFQRSRSDEEHKVNAPSAPPFIVSMQATAAHQVDSFLQAGMTEEDLQRAFRKYPSLGNLEVMVRQLLSMGCYPAQDIFDAIVVRKYTREGDIVSYCMDALSRKEEECSNPNQGMSSVAPIERSPGHSRDDLFLQEVFYGHEHILRSWRSMIEEAQRMGFPIIDILEAIIIRNVTTIAGVIDCCVSKRAQDSRPPDCSIKDLRHHLKNLPRTQTLNLAPTHQHSQPGSESGPWAADDEYTRKQQEEREAALKREEENKRIKDAARTQKQQADEQRRRMREDQESLEAALRQSLDDSISAASTDTRSAREARLDSAKPAQSFLNADILEIARREYKIKLGLVAMIAKLTDLGFDQTEVTSAVSLEECKNIFSIVKTVRRRATYCNDIWDDSRDEDPERDEQVLNLIRFLVLDVGWDRDQVADAIVFDYCTTTEEVMEVFDFLDVDSRRPASAAAAVAQVTPPPSQPPGRRNLRSRSSLALAKASDKVKYATEMLERGSKAMPPGHWQDHVQSMDRFEVMAVLNHFYKLPTKEKWLCTSTLRGKLVRFESELAHSIL